MKVVVCTVGALADPWQLPMSFYAGRARPGHYRAIAGLGFELAARLAPMRSRRRA